MKELILEIIVRLTGDYFVQGDGMDIRMLPFVGTAQGKYFTGKTIGESVDTQRISKDGSLELSARYMLEGMDYQVKPCRVFIENNGNNSTGEICCTPKIVTDSVALKEWETISLTSKVEPIPDGVRVSIFKMQG